MFGGQPKLHLFIAFGIREDAEQVKTTKYAEEMLDRLRKAYDTVPGNVTSHITTRKLK